MKNNGTAEGSDMFLLFLDYGNIMGSHISGTYFFFRQLRFKYKRANNFSPSWSKNFICPGRIKNDNKLSKIEIDSDFLTLISRFDQSLRRQGRKLIL